MQMNWRAKDDSTIVFNLDECRLKQIEVGESEYVIQCQSDFWCFSRLRGGISKTLMEKQCILSLALLTFLYLLQDSHSDTHPGDIRALEIIKASIDATSIPPSSCIGSWNFSEDPCDARSSAKFVCGFSCDETNPRSKRITRLELDGSGYTGAISRTIGELSSLQVLDLSHNSFMGSIPSEIGKLGNLEKLDLSGNKLSGSLPGALSGLRKLQYLALSENELSGMVPGNQFASMGNLERLHIQKNRFFGPFPTSITNAKNLRYLDASSNAFSGNLAFSQLPKSLFQISLRANRFTGQLVDRDISKFLDLEVLDLSNNSFSGTVISALFLLPNLQQLNVSRNQFSSIQLDRSSLDLSHSMMVAFDASHNKIRGSLPVLLANLTRLSALSLSYNLFSGRIPEAYAKKAASAKSNVLPLARLFLDGNYLQGELPPLFMKPLPNLRSASFIYNCLKNCSPKFSFCQGGSQRPQSQCKS